MRATQPGSHLREFQNSLSDPERRLRLVTRPVPAGTPPGAAQKLNPEPSRLSPRSSAVLEPLPVAQASLPHSRQVAGRQVVGGQASQDWSVLHPAGRIAAAARSPYLLPPVHRVSDALEN